MEAGKCRRWSRSAHSSVCLAREGPSLSAFASLLGGKRYQRCLARPKINQTAALRILASLPTPCCLPELEGRGKPTRSGALFHPFGSSVEYREISGGPLCKSTCR